VPSNCMRLSVKKAALIALGECHVQEIRGSPVAFRGFLPRKTTPRDLYETTVIAKPLYSGFALPVGDGTIRPEIGLGASRDRFGNFGDLGKLLVVQLHTQARPLVGIQLAVFEVQAHRQVG
jgi:hypothetical protein